MSDKCEDCGRESPTTRERADGAVRCIVCDSKRDESDGRAGGAGA